jgi:hypothetical protein
VDIGGDQVTTSIDVSIGYEPSSQGLTWQEVLHETGMELVAVAQAPVTCVETIEVCGPELGALAIP